ncbi:MAG: hypothetical protein ABIL07_04615 [candidate division WOR-3 bacterium]
MQSIPDEVVEKTFEEMSILEPDEIKILINKMGEEQPYVLAYLFETGEHEFNESEKEVFFYLGIGIWRMMSSRYAPLPLVLPILLDEIEEENLKIFDSLQKMDAERFVECIGQIIDNHSQPAILFYVVDLLIEEEIDVAPNKIGIMFIYLKILIDAFQKAIELKKIERPWKI